MARRCAGKSSWWACLSLWLVPTTAPAQSVPLVLILDPAATQIRFRLPATLHTVHGSARLEEGHIRFQRSGGGASGRIVIDLRSAETGIDARDEIMHEQVFESARYPTIEFEPDVLVVEESDRNQATIRLSGRVAIHGVSHRLTIPARVHREQERLRVQASFTIPYVDWGMKDVSRFLLRVSDEVEIEIEAEGTLSPPRENSS